ncbi:hypothetical protein BDV93DRAFT_176814 [Ceratobasidium sp. AG-I]|nr:hypothetical protein BDV93DRAFT_176814 [Ceratobasidium sp. AG-I]
MCYTRLYPVTSGVESEVWSGVAEKRDSWSELRMLGRRPGTAGQFSYPSGASFELCRTMPHFS